MTKPSILLVNPWIHDFAAYDLWARPMGLLILGTRLKRLGWEPILVDFLETDHPEMTPVKVKPHAHGRFAKTPIPRPEPLEGIPRTYSRYGVQPEIIEKDLLSIPTPQAIFITSMMTYWYPGVRETMSLVRRIFPEVPVLLGGIYASLLPGHARGRVQADDVVVGPGEIALAQSLHKLTGISGTGHAGDVGLECAPALDLMRSVRFVPLLTSRGCPFKCAYCASGKLVPAFIRRSVREVLDEVEAACVRYGVKDIALYDDAFLVDAARHAVPILEAVAQRLPGMRWHTPNGLHASAIDERVASAMKRAGFETIRLGLESSSDRFHRDTGGKTSFRSFVAAVRHLKDAGFAPHQIGAYLLVGLPGQAKAQIEDDVSLCIEAGAFPKLAEYSPIPGTALWPQAVRTSRYSLTEEPLFHNCTLLPCAEGGVDSQFLNAIRKGIHRSLESAAAKGIKPKGFQEIPDFGHSVE